MLLSAFAFSISRTCCVRCCREAQVNVVSYWMRSNYVLNRPPRQRPAMAALHLSKALSVQAGERMR